MPLYNAVINLMTKELDKDLFIIENKLIQYGEKRDVAPETAAQLKETNFSDVEIFFHIGIERTGTKYLQKKVFPNYKSVHFINKNQYLKAKEIILKKEYPRYLVSMELSLNDHFETEISDFMDTFPNTKIIMVFRPIGKWMVSHYKRIVKNGVNIEFSDLWSVDNDAWYTPKELFFMKKLQFLESKIIQKPLFLLYEELKHQPLLYLEKLAIYVGEDFNASEQDLNYVHSSYSTKQLIALKWVMNYVQIARIKPYENKIANWLHRLKVDSVRYVTMFIAKVLPQKIFEDKELIEKEDIEYIHHYYAKDWSETLEYVKEYSRY